MPGIGRRVVIVLASMIPVVANAQSPPTRVERAVGPLADSLRAFATGMADRLRALDLAGTLRLYGDTSHFVHVENGKVVSWSEMTTSMLTYFRTATSNPVVLVGEPGVTLIDRDNAVVYVQHRTEASAGREAHQGVWTGVLHRFRDGWRIVHSHSSDP
jgi:hypothetical protein